MMTGATPHAILALAETLESRWRCYRQSGKFEAYVEFALCLDSLTEGLKRLQLPGLQRSCQELENKTLPLFGDADSHPISDERSAQLEEMLACLLNELRQRETPAVDARRPQEGAANDAKAWSKPRDVLIVCREGHAWGQALIQQLNFYGFRPLLGTWEEPGEVTSPPLAVVFIPDSEGEFPPAAIDTIRRLRQKYQGSQLCCLGVPVTLQSIVTLQRAGIDSCMPDDGHMVGDVLSRILEVVHAHEDEQPRVLVVEDSKTAVAHIRRSLSQYGIDSLAINDPSNLLETISSYQPDLVLMDMYMPNCTGVEATRVLRQVPEFQSLPVIYLSSETDIAQQVEALRLGGDQFLTKPINPVILASVVKTKIERYHEMLRSSQHDSLTGLLNHSAAKTRLDRLVKQAGSGGRLAVAMIDIDRFKSINDTYGHPVGDQVIRGLAWLLSARLRSGDLIGRYGGEEFIVALHGASIPEAKEVMENVRVAFEQLPHPHARGVLHATFSCGVSNLQDYADGSDLIQAADEALLLAKRSGRNRVLLARAPEVCLVETRCEQAMEPAPADLPLPGQSAA